MEQDYVYACAFSLTVKPAPVAPDLQLEDESEKEDFKSGAAI